MYLVAPKSPLSHFRRVTALSLTLALTACVSAPEKYTEPSAVEFTEAYLRPAALPLDASQTDLSLSDIQQRTLSHNSEYGRQERLFIEQVRQAGHRAKDYLPQTYLNAFSTWRSNVNAQVGTKIGDENQEGQREFFTGQDRGYGVGNLTATWDLLELGLGGLKRNQRHISAFKQGEQNQYLCQKLMVDVEQAYWKMLAYEKAAAKQAWLKERIAYGLELSKTRMEDNPETVLQELMFQRELLDINRWYESIFRGLASAKADLARLMNLPAGQTFTLADAVLPNSDIKAETDIVALIETAYQNRPEIRQALYAKDLTTLENRLIYWRQFPAVKLFVSANTDTNSFLLNQNFAATGLNLSWDLLRLGQMKETRKKSNYRQQDRAFETEVLASAVMTQVMIAQTQVQQLTHDLSLAWQAHGVQTKITEELKQSVETDGKPETYWIKEELMRELTTLREDLARAELYGAQARLNQSLGLVSVCQTPSETGTEPTPSVEGPTHNLEAQSAQNATESYRSPYAQFPENWMQSNAATPQVRNAKRYRRRG